MVKIHGRRRRWPHACGLQYSIWVLKARRLASGLKEPATFSNCGNVLRYLLIFNGFGQSAANGQFDQGSETEWKWVLKNA